MGFHAWAPGRVNLIGEHTDYTGGLVCPMAIQLGIAIDGLPDDGVVRVSSATEAGSVEFALPISDPRSVRPTWGRYIAGVAALLDEPRGFDATITSTLPAGAGLSSSAALEVAAAMALGAAADSTPTQIAAIAQAAEQQATGMPCGIMDQMASACGIAGHALRIDCGTGEITPVAVPDGARIVVIHSGQSRRLVDSAYAERRHQCESAETVIGPLRHASLGDLDAVADDTTRRRAHHVISENLRVDEFIGALAGGDLAAAGDAMARSHVSLRDDFEVSTVVLDDLVEHLMAIDGVYGARLTGAGFGGCVVVLCRPDVTPIPSGLQGWLVEPSAGASITYED